ncbi:SDR family NAD(P)-dependent oxidoreductase [Leifsonia kafniensis]
MSTIEPLLAGRRAVITGGARGLGYAMAKAIAASGASIALLDRLDTVESAAARLADETGADAIGVNVDVTDEASVESAFDAVTARFGTADILVNSAGMTLGAPAIDTEVADWNRLFEVNVAGTFLTSRTFARAFVAANAGLPGAERGVASIVNVSSMSAFAVNIPQTQAAYNTSKAAVSMLTSSLAIEWLPLGIRVNAIAPGYFASDMTRDFVAENPDMAEAWISKIPSGRMGQPDELGDLVVYLASERSAYVVGQSFRIDGGYTVV